MEITKIKHPYVMKVKEVCGGRATIEGTRIPVWIIIGWLERGYTPELIQKDIYPHLTLAQIYDAISYYYDNKEEVDQDLKENNPDEEDLARRIAKWKSQSSS